MKRLFLDVTLCAGYRGDHPVGIVRVEAEFIRFLDANYTYFREQGYDLHLCQVVGRNYCEIPPSQIFAHVRKLFQWADATPVAACATSITHDHSASPKTHPPLDQQLRNYIFMLSRKILRLLPAQKADDIREGYYGLRLCLRAALRLIGLRTRSHTPAPTPDNVGKITHPFQDGDVLLVLGNPYTYHAQSILPKVVTDMRLRQIFMLHDMIPLVRPDLTLPGLYAKYRDFTTYLAQATDVVICVSGHTKSDFQRWCAAQNLTIKASVEHCILGSEISTQDPIMPEIPDVDLTQDFVLCVGTLEVRKNHGWLLEIWTALQNDARAPLPLILAGTKGWLCDDFLIRLQQFDAAFPNLITHCIDINDQELTWLYRNCRFGVYPSLYEGWGLPVQETLQYGKPVIANAVSAIPEAGAGLATLVETGNLGQWVNAVQTHMFNDDFLAKKTAQISAQHTPKRWDDWARELWELLHRNM
ncbi:MAG: glycosyltransferase [Pseudomonadota bacterium]